MNDRERQLVNNLLTAVDNARDSLNEAMMEFATQLTQEEARLRDEAVERMHRFEDWKDQYNSAMADKNGGRR